MLKWSPSDYCSPPRIMVAKVTRPAMYGKRLVATLSLRRFARSCRTRRCPVWKYRESGCPKSRPHRDYDGLGTVLGGLITISDTNSPSSPDFKAAFTLSSPTAADPWMTFRPNRFVDRVRVEGDGCTGV